MSLSAVRKKLKKIWCSILETDSVSGNVNFFDAGGSSMLLIKLKEQIYDEFGAEISVVELMTYTTVGSQAEFLVNVL